VLEDQHHVDVVVDLDEGRVEGDRVEGRAGSSARQPAAAAGAAGARSAAWT
jgi:hypothetical protein